MEYVAYNIDYTPKLSTSIGQEKSPVSYIQQFDIMFKIWSYDFLIFLMETKIKTDSKLRPIDYEPACQDIDLLKLTNESALHTQSKLIHKPIHSDHLHNLCFTPSQSQNNTVLLRRHAELARRQRFALSLHLSTAFPFSPLWNTRKTP